MNDAGVADAIPSAVPASIEKSWATTAAGSTETYNDKVVRQFTIATVLGHHRHGRGCFHRRTAYLADAELWRPWLAYGRHIAFWP
jgi:hypothetical protein